jgi:hypothetical protein
MRNDDSKGASPPTPAGEPEKPADDERSLSLWQVLTSALAAGFGVQSSKNRERDFKRGKASQFIVIGIVFTAAFVVAMVFLVRFVLSVATGS